MTLDPGEHGTVWVTTRIGLDSAPGALPGPGPKPDAGSTGRGGPTSGHLGSRVSRDQPLTWPSSAWGAGRGLGSPDLAITGDPALRGTQGPSLEQGGKRRFREAKEQRREKAPWGGRSCLRASVGHSDGKGCPQGPPEWARDPGSSGRGQRRAAPRGRGCSWTTGTCRVSPLALLWARGVRSGAGSRWSKPCATAPPGLPLGGTLGAGGQASLRAGAGGLGPRPPPPPTPPATGSRQVGRDSWAWEGYWLPRRGPGSQQLHGNRGARSCPENGGCDGKASPRVHIPPGPRFRSGSAFRPGSRAGLPRGCTHGLTRQLCTEPRAHAGR